jgi:hypothetical protein
LYPAAVDAIPAALVAMAEAIALDPPSAGARHVVAPVTDATAL